MEYARDVCEVTVVHQEAVAAARGVMLPEAEALAMAEVFKVLGDCTRVRLVTALKAGELCVCDLACVLGLSASAVSHQLRVLRGARMVKGRREGKLVFYSLDDEHVERLLAEVQEHVREDRTALAGDLHRGYEYEE